MLSEDAVGTTVKAHERASLDNITDDSGIDTREHWKTPRRNMYRVMASFYGFIVFGMSDASIGALLPYLEEDYGLSYLVVSIAFLTPFTGYIISALFGEYLHRYLGRWGVAVMGTCLQLVCYIICVCHPPFPLFVVAYGICGFGNGAIEASWNSWLGGLQNSNQIMGLLHGFYGAGGIICPAIFTAMTGSGLRWNICYAVMIGFSSCSVIFSTIAYWGDGPKKYRAGFTKEDQESSPIKDIAKTKVSPQTIRHTWYRNSMLTSDRVDCFAVSVYVRRCRGHLRRLDFDIHD